VGSLGVAQLEVRGASLGHRLEVAASLMGVWSEVRGASLGHRLEVAASLMGV
jgi:hypothetical protein